MRGFIRRALSPATVIALVALVIAAGGTSYAVSRLPSNSVGTVQIKSHAVTTPKLATSAAARIAGLTYRTTTATVPAGMGMVVDVAAPAGLTAIAGGAEAPHIPNAFMIDSHPTKTGWEASVGNTTDTPVPITVWAICAKAESGAARLTAGAAQMHRFALDR